MKWFVASVLVMIFIGCGSSKKALIKTVEKNSEKIDSNDSIFLRLQKGSDLIIAYLATPTAWDHSRFYELFANKGKDWTAYKYTIKSVIRLGEKLYDLDSFPVPRRYGDSVLNIFKEQKSWEIKALKGDAEAGCPHLAVDKDPGCMIYDSDDEWLFIITRNFYNVVKFYNPNFFERCCPGWEPRIRYLKTIDPIRAFIKSKR